VEVSHAGGASGHWNAESGATWFGRLTAQFPHLAWINPLPRAQWGRTPSIGMVRQLLEDRMHPLTPDGLSAAMAALAK
jgi:uncharacterized protein with von Willebrand factor type A (vWA) domain